MASVRLLSSFSSLFTMIAVSLVIAAHTAFGQSATAPSGSASPAAQAPAGEANQPSCALMSDKELPLGTTIQARLNGIFDAAHQKAGKSFWVNVARGVVFPECTMEADAPIYGHVTAASATKNPSASELSVQFDHADCARKGKKEMKLWLVGVVAPPDSSSSLHDQIPTEVHGVRQISDVVAGTNAYDARLNPGGPPNTVHPGIVVGYKDLKLEPQGGPSCSARLTSGNRNIELAPGTLLLLVVRESK